jgi:hypothetical protein
MTEYVSSVWIQRGREGNVHSAADTTAATTAQLHLFLAGLTIDVNFCCGNMCFIYGLW